MKMTSLKLIAALSIAFSFVTAHAEGELKADREAINNACAQEAQAAGCGDKKVGEGMLKCIHAYKKEHKDFKASEGCKTALKQLRHDRKEKKAKREEAKKNG